MGVLFISTDGQNFIPFGGEITEMNLELTPESEEPSIKASKPSELTFEAEMRIDPFVLFGLLTGEKLTNNYLKMHGGVIQRRKTIKRYRERRK